MQGHGERKKTGYQQAGNEDSDSWASQFDFSGNDCGGCGFERNPAGSADVSGPARACAGNPHFRRSGIKFPGNY